MLKFWQTSVMITSVKISHPAANNPRIKTAKAAAERETVKITKSKRIPSHLLAVA